MKSHLRVKKGGGKGQDESYLNAILQGDHHGLNEIYRQFSHRIITYILNFGGTREDAKDIFQEGILIIYKKAQADGFKLTSAFGTYLFGICKYLWMNQTQKRHRQDLSMDYAENEAALENVEEAITQRTKHTLYRKKFQELGEDCQQVLSLFFEGADMKKIAEAMGYSSENYARKRKFKCKEKLVNLIKADRVYQELTEP